MTDEQFTEELRLHQTWLDSDGRKGRRANLSHMGLVEAIALRKSLRKTVAKPEGDA